MIESCQDFDLAKCSLAIRLMLKRGDFLDGNFGFGLIIKGGPGKWMSFLLAPNLWHSKISKSDSTIELETRNVLITA